MSRAPYRGMTLAVLAMFMLAGCANTSDVRIVASRPVSESTTSINNQPLEAPDDDGESDTSTPTSSQPPLSAETTDIELSEVVDVDPKRIPQPDDAIVAAAILDIEEWATEVLIDTYGLDGTPARGGVFAGHPDRRVALPGCGTDSTDYRDLMEYVALYCPVDEFVIYDDGPDGLLGSLAAENGGISIGVVLAHEFGHFIQDRVGVLDRNLPTVVTEQHADCLAGAWLGRASAGRSPNLTIGSDAIRAGLIALVQVRDPAGVDTLSPGGHGTAFDRVGAFQLGIDGGADRCAGIIDDPLPLMPNAYLSMDDYLRGGDAPYDCTTVDDPTCTDSWQFLGEDLNEFWSLSLGASIEMEAWPVDSIAGVCADLRIVDGPIARCPTSNLVVFDAQNVFDLYVEFGDFTLGYLLGLAWADLVLEREGSSVQSEPALADCLVGAWVDDITLGSRRSPNRESTVVTSPGDPDEAITMLIHLADDTSSTTLFDRVAAFRTGVLNGLERCLVPG